MTHTDVAQNISLSHYTDVLRRRWRVLVLCALLGLGAAGGYLAVAPQSATATTALSVNVISTDPFNPSRPASGLLDPAGEAQVASSFTVAERAATRLGGELTPEQIRGSLEVAGVSDTAILRISSTAGTPDTARAIADAVSEEFLGFRQEQAQARIDRTLAQSEARLENLREELGTVTMRLNEAEPGSAEEAQAETDRSLVTLEINSVLAQAASTEGIDTTGGSVLNPASRSAVQIAPPTTLILATGLLVGFGFGILAAFAVNSLGSRLRGSRDVVQNGGRTVLGELDERRTSIPPKDEDLDELRAIRERMLADEALTSRVGVCAIIDECPPDHAAEVPVNLAFVVALSGVPVEFVGLDMTEDFLIGAVSALDLRAETTSGAGRRFVSRGTPRFSLYVPPAAETPIADEPISHAVRDELTARRQDVLVIMAVPPGTSEATRLAACRLSDTAVALVARGSTKMAALAGAARDVRHMGGHVLGTVLVGHHRTFTVRPSPSTEAEADVRAPEPRAADLSPGHGHQPSGIPR